jgi:hypothetical protein
MRNIRRFTAAAAIATLLTAGLSMIQLLEKARAEDVSQVVRIGQVVEISSTTVTLREDTGRYTYRLSSTGRQALDAARIGVGDRVRVYAYDIWQIAYDFKKM